MPDQHNKTASKPKPKLASNGNFLCRSKSSECDAVFSTPDEEMAHNVKVHCTCVECGRTFVSERTLKRHLVDIHKGLLLYECKFCGKKFEQSGKRYSHMIKEHGYKSKILPKCKICDIAFNSDKEKLEHQKAAHTKCSVCGLSFHSTQSLKIHILSVHEKQKPFKCQKCDYRCSQRSGLKVHDGRVHQKKKDIVCSYCGKAFSRNNNLTTHMKNCHTSERKHPCKLCPKKFVFATHLAKHVLSEHQTTKVSNVLLPHECKDCEKTFAQSTELQQHIRYKHPKQFFCKACNIIFLTAESLKRHEEKHIEMRHPC